MSGRNHGPPIPMKGAPQSGFSPSFHEPRIPRGGLGPAPHPEFLEEMRETRFGMGPRQPPPHPAILEERLAAQHEDVQAFLMDNQRLAATHVALKQELEVTQFDLQRTDHYARALHTENDMKTRELFDKSVKMEMDLGAVDNMRAELMKVRADIQELTAAKQELTAKVQMMTQDLTRMTADLQQAPAIKAEIEGLKQELHRARAAIEYEKRGYSENYEHGQAMEKKLLSMARELEKLRAELANAEKRSHVPAPVANPAAAGYNANYGNAEAGYGANPYPGGYGMNPMHPAQPGVEAYPQYGQGPGGWGTYDMQRAQGPR